VAQISPLGEPDLIQKSPCGIRGGQSGFGTDFSPSTSAVPRQYHSTKAECPHVHPLPSVQGLATDSLVI